MLNEEGARLLSCFWVLTDNEVEKSFYLPFAVGGWFMKRFIKLGRAGLGTKRKPVVEVHDNNILHVLVIPLYAVYK